MKILLVDDEPFARKRLRTLLAAEAGIEVVGECSTASEARSALERSRPDVVLLDVTMPGEDGIQLAQSLEGKLRPRAIMITAHAQFAVDAFEARALDYLLKPVRPARLHQALMRAREEIHKDKATGKSEGTDDLLRRLSVKAGKQVFFIEVSQIDWIGAAGNYMVVHSQGQSHVVRETMTDLERSLPPRQFFRLNRSAIVNVKAVKTAHQKSPGEYFVELVDGTTLSVTCGLRELRQWVKFAAFGRLCRGTP